MRMTQSSHRLDGPFSWLVCISSSLCTFLVATVCLAAGMYYVMFLDAFNEGKGFTALTTSINFGTVSLAGE